MAIPLQCIMHKFFNNFQFLINFFENSRSADWFSKIGENFIFPRMTPVKARKLRLEWPTADDQLFPAQVRIYTKS